MYSVFLLIKKGQNDEQYTLMDFQKITFRIENNNITLCKYSLAFSLTVGNELTIGARNVEFCMKVLNVVKILCEYCLYV